MGSANTTLALQFEREKSNMTKLIYAFSKVSLVFGSISFSSGLQHIDNAKGDISEESSVGGLSSSCHDSAIVNGITVLLAILESRKNASANSLGGNSEDGGGGGDSDGGGGGGGTGSGTDEAIKQQRLLDETVGAIIPR